MNVAEFFPVLTGLMVYISIRLARRKKSRKLFIWSMCLGIAAQLLLVLFGILAGHLSFLAHIFPFTGFVQNLWDEYRDGRKAVKVR